MLNKRLFLFLFLLIPMASALDINDRLFVNTVTNYSIYINETATFSGINVTDSGRIEFYGLDTSSTIGKFWNVNDTYTSVIDIFGLTNSLIYYGNGTIAQESFSGDINITVPILSSVTVMNNYIINNTTPTPSNDPISSGGGGSTTKVNNTLLDDLLIQVENLDNSFIYFGNESIYYYASGSLNITLGDGDYFYIVDYEKIVPFNENNGTTAHDRSSNGNDLTIVGATWTTDGALRTLVAITDYTINPTTGLFTIVNDDYSWAELLSSWNYDSEDSKTRLILKDGEEAIGDNSSIMGILLTIVLLGVVLTIIIKTFMNKTNRI